MTNSDNLTMEELREQLEAERRKSKLLEESLHQERGRRIAVEETLAAMKSKQESYYNQSEAEEERLANKFMITIDKVKKEKFQLAQELEQEEEYVTSILIKQLALIRKEKETVGNKVSELKRQLEHLKCDRERIARQVEAEEEFMANAFIKKLREVQCDKNEFEARLWEKRNGYGSSRPTSSTQSRSSSFSIDLSSVHSGVSSEAHPPSSLGNAASIAAAVISSAEDEDHLCGQLHISAHQQMQQFHHPMHSFVHIQLGNSPHSAPSSLFSSPRDI